MLVMGLAVMGALFVLVTKGMVRGLDSGHPVEYLQSSCIAGAIVLSILPILRILDLVSLPYWFVALLCGDVYYFILSLCLGLYLDVTWWGDVAHSITAAIVASTVFVALCVVQARSPPHVALGRKGGIVTMTFLAGGAFGGIWEILEGYTDTLVGEAYMSYGAWDTLGDLRADLVGLVAATAIAWLVLRKREPEQVSSGVKVGRKAVRGRL
jgi:uncharacterized membrane protein YvlD (DUF360 family)